MPSYSICGFQRLISAFLLTLSLSLPSRVDAQGANVGTAVDQLTAALIRGEKGVNPAGDLQFSLPVLTIPGRNRLDFPLHLTYQSNIHRGDVASWVGLGFNLTIGHVSRSVTNVVDEQAPWMFGPNKFHLDRNSAVGEYPGAMRSNGDPFDTYYLHLSDGTVPLEVVPDANGIAPILPLRWSAHLIGYNFGPNYAIYNNQLLSEFIPNFVVVSPQGTRYEFTHASQVRIDNDAPTDGLRVHFKYPISWELTAILSSDYKDMNSNGPDDADVGAWIKINYNDYAHSAVNQTPIDYSNLHYIHLGAHYYGFGPWAGSLSDPQRVQTHLYYDHSVVSSIETPSHLATFLTSPRTDPPSRNGRSLLRLDRIDLVAKRDGQLIKRVDFQYATVANNGNGLWESNEQLNRNSLTLTGLQLLGAPPLRFEYAANPTSIADPLLDPTYLSPTAWNLSKVTLPTGGSIAYEYENNTYNWFYTTADFIVTPDQRSVVPWSTYYRSVPISTSSGRLRRSVVSDGLGPAKEWMFEYGEGIAYEPRNSFRRYVAPNHTQQYYAYTGYRSITTRLPEGRGSVISYFTSGVTSSHLEYTVGQPPPSPTLTATESQPDAYNPSTYYYEYNWAKRGMLWRQELVSSTGVLKNRVTETLSFVEQRRWNETHWRPVGDSGWNWFVLKSIWARRDATTTEQDEIVTTISRVYDPDNGLPLRIWQQGSDGVDRIEERTYAHDEYLLLKQLNMLEQLFMTVTYVGSIAPANARSAERTTWSLPPPPGSAYPAEEHRWRERDAITSFGGKNDPDFVLWKRRTHDQYGNVTSEEDGNGAITQYAYGSGHSVRAAEIVNSPDPVYYDDFDGTQRPFPLAGGTIQNGIRQGSYIANRNRSYTGFSLHVDVNLFGGGPTAWLGVHFGTTTENQSDPNGYTVRYQQDGVVRLYRGSTELVSSPTSLPLVAIAPPRRLFIRVSGAEVFVSSDGEPIIRFTNSVPIPAGHVNLCASVGGGATAFDNYRLAGPDGIGRTYPVIQFESYPVHTFQRTDGMIDENGVGTFNEYDVAGRPVVVWSGFAVAPDFPFFNKIGAIAYNDALATGGSFDPTSPNEIIALAYGNEVSSVATHHYLDGLGRPVQRLVPRAGSVDIITHTEVDALGKARRVYKAFEVARSTDAHTYDPYYANHASAYYPDLGVFAHSEYVSTDDPLQRLLRRSHPGTAFQLNGGHDQEWTYGPNVAADGTGYPDYRLQKERKRDEDGNMHDTFRDRDGRIVRTVTDSSLPYPARLNLATQFQYDVLGRLIATTDPAARVSTNDYLTTGELSQRTTPDAGTIQHFYDRAGNLRLTRDNRYSAVQNAVNVNGTILLAGTATGTFTLTQPGRVAITGRVLSEVTPGDNIVVRVRAANATILETASAGNGQPLSVTTTVRLPSGTYNYEAVAGGVGITSYDILCDSGYDFIYRKYDKLNRVIEIGEYLQTEPISKFTFVSGDDVSFPTVGGAAWRTFAYDMPSADPGVPPQRNLRGRVSMARGFNEGGTSHVQYFSYDGLGRVEWLLWTGPTSAKKLIYTYDLQGRLLTKRIVEPQDPGLSVNYFYEYDDVGRLARVFSSAGTDSVGTSRVRDVEYTYQATDKVRRVQLGTAQGVDYRYNGRDWITSINHPALTTALDPGGDGGNGIPIDRYGAQVGYETLAEIGTAQSAVAQYDGDPSWTAYAIAGATFSIGGSHLPTTKVGFTYRYDGANRLTSADFGYYSTDPDFGLTKWWATTAYDEASYALDRTGNIVTRVRRDASATVMDNMTYQYFGSQNRLRHIDDTAPASVSTTDIDDQAPDNYRYNGAGYCQQDLTRGIGLIVYDLFGLPIAIHKTDGSLLRSSYDANGQPVRRDLGGGVSNFYVAGPSGELESIVYGPSPAAARMFVIRGNHEVGQIRNATTWSRFFYLMDHVGSIRVYVDAAGNVAAYHDVTPYGDQLEGRSISSPSVDARFRFVGKAEHGGSSYYQFDARDLEARSGRWTSIEPLEAETAAWSPYVYGRANPLRYVDRDGRAVETAWDAFNIALGAQSFVNSVVAGDVGSAVVDGVGVAVDVVAAMVPFVPGGMATSIRLARAGDGFGGASSRAAEAARSIAGKASDPDAIGLSKQLASQDQMSQIGIVTAGHGSDEVFRDSKRVARAYGGSPDDWVKKSSIHFVARDGTKIQTHWVENIKTGERVEWKTKLEREEASRKK